MRQGKNPAQQRTFDAAQLANASHLGGLIGEYPKTRKPEVMRMLRGFGVLLLGCLLAALSIHLLSPLLAIAGAVLGALGLAYAAESLFYLTSRHMYAFTDGFIYFKRSKPVVVRWEDVSVMLKRRQEFAYVAQSVEIQHADGHSVTLRIRDTDPFSVLLDTRAVGALKAKWMMKAYEAGRVLIFGPLELSLQGVSYEKRLLPWSDIDQIFLLSGTLHIRTVQEKLSDWATIPEADRIRNISLFFELSRHILKARRPSL